MDKTLVIFKDMAGKRGRPSNYVSGQKGMQRLAPTHEAIMDWILLNPGKGLRECAAFFGYSVGGIGWIVNSDLFQAKLAERRREIETVLAADIPAKLTILGSVAIDRTLEVIEKTTDPDVIVDIFDKTLHRLGYAPSKQTGPAIQFNTQNNSFTVSPEELRQAKAVMLQAANGVPVLAPAAAFEQRPNDE